MKQYRIVRRKGDPHYYVQESGIFWWLVYNILRVPGYDFTSLLGARRFIRWMKKQNAINKQVGEWQ